MADVIHALLRKGFKTSEFWLAVLALVLPYVANIGTDKIQAWGAAHGWIGGLVVAVYIAARAYVKGTALKSETVYSSAVLSDAGAPAGTPTPYVPNADSLASARAGDAAGTPPVATGGNVGTAAR